MVIVLQLLLHLLYIVHGDQSQHLAYSRHKTQQHSCLQVVLLQAVSNSTQLLQSCQAPLMKMLTQTQSVIVLTVSTCLHLRLNQQLLLPT